MEQEVWRAVPSYKGLYEVSNMGNVRSVPAPGIKGRGNYYRELSKGLNRYGYHVVSLSKRDKRKLKTVHRLVAEAFLDDYSELLHVDHISGDRSDSRLANLRMSTQTQNMGNSQKSKSITSSKYKGVYWNKRDKRWIARINKDKKMVWCKYFKDEIAAAHAYDKKLIEEYGEYAMTNDKLGLYVMEHSEEKG